MIDKPVSPAGNAPATFSPLVRAVIDSVSEGVVIFDQQGRLLYANAPARRVIDGQNGGGDVRNRLQTLGARFTPLKNTDWSTDTRRARASGHHRDLAGHERQARGNRAAARYQSHDALATSQVLRDGRLPRLSVGS